MRNNLTNQLIVSEVETLEQRRLLSGGQLDSTFAGGAVFGDAHTSGHDVAVQADGKVLVAFQRFAADFAPAGGFNVARYNANGTLDSTFGTGGIASVSLGSLVGFPTHLALQSDGKVVVGGVQRTFKPDSSVADDPVVVRLTSAGKLDTTFSGDGKLEFTGSNPDYYLLYDLAVDSSNKILFVVGSLSGKSTIVRLSSAGNFDSTFDGDGMRTVDKAGYGHLAFTPDRKIMFLVGNSPVLRRLLDDGSTDPSFNGGRPKTIVQRFYVIDMLVTAQNKTLLLGDTDAGLALRRYGSGGGLEWQRDYDFAKSVNAEMAFAAGGKVLIAAIPNFGPNYGKPLVARLTPEGEIDSSFADNGLATAQLATASYGSDIALTPTGNIVVSGYATESASDLHYFAARFLGDGTTPPPVGGDIAIKDGVLTIDSTSSADVVTVDPSTAGNVTVGLNATSKTFALSEFSSILVNANAGNDKVTINAAIAKPAKLLGGEGNDSLVGGGGDDTIDGGTGGDTMKGGAGRDTLDYSSRTANLTIGPGTLSDDGEANEHDNVATDFETILGGAGNDSIKGTAAPNLLVGNGGNDSILANFGNDTLSGDAGTDTLNGENGTDTAINASGDRLIGIENGGGGVTSSIDAQRRLIINGTAGNDDISLYINDNEAGISGNGGPTFARSAFDSIIINGNGGSDDVEIGRDGNTAKPPILVDGHLGSVDLALDNADATVLGGAGNDGVALDVNHGGLDGSTVWFTGGAGDDRISFGGNEADNAKIGAFDGGAGVDSIWAGWPNSLNFVDLGLYPGVENVSLNFGTIIGNDLPNKLELDEGGGSLIGNGGNDTLTGGENQVYIDGGDGDDYITAFSDPEPEPAELLGGNGNDTIIGGPLGDKIFGGPGNDSLNGSLGDDTIDGGTGSDTIKGGEGVDTADYSSRTADLTIGIGTLADDGEAGEHDNVYLDIEKVIGGSGNDLIKGSAANNILLGGAGNDTVRGNYGDDNLFGGSGDDLLVGEAGPDILDGQAGFDRATSDGFDTLISIEGPQ